MAKIIIRAKRAYTNEQIATLTEYFSEGALKEILSEDRPSTPYTVDGEEKQMEQVSPMRALAYEILDFKEWDKTRKGGRNTCTVFEGNVFYKKNAFKHKLIAIAAESNGDGTFRILWVKGGKVSKIGTPEDFIYATTVWEIESVERYIIK